MAKQHSQKPVPSGIGLAAIAATLTAIPGVVLLAITALAINLFSPEQEANLRGLMRAISLGLGSIALVGILAGFIDARHGAGSQQLSAFCAKLNTALLAIIVAIFFLG